MKIEIDELLLSNSKQEVKYFPSRSLAEHLIVKHGIEIAGNEDPYDLVLQHRTEHKEYKSKTYTNIAVVKHKHRKII